MGVIGDLGAHMVDIVRFMGEEFASVDATEKTTKTGKRVFLSEIQ